MPSGNIYDATSGQLISYGGAPGPFVGATASTSGAAGVVPAPSAGDGNKVLRGDGTWGDSAGPVIAGVENTTTSTSVYASGDYVLVMGALYEVTSAVAVGDTLAPGINLSQNPTKVMTEITKVNQNLTLNYAQSSLPQNTDINTFLQSVLEKLYPKAISLFKNGTFVGQYTTNPTITGYATSGQPSVGSNAITFTVPPGNSGSNKGTAILFKTLVNLDDFTKIKLVTSLGTVEKDISGQQYGSKYLSIFVNGEAYSNTHTVYVTLEDSNTTVGGSKKLSMTNAGNTGTTFTVSELTVE